mmetsp:Transcript_96328/g.170314  ORF Transcript_96328/g.170314 Transcript_96328/m.170314 type:complete len:360 (-) Transcript_96328:105-1184(-)
MTLQRCFARAVDWHGTVEPNSQIAGAVGSRTAATGSEACVRHRARAATVEGSRYAGRTRRATARGWRVFGPLLPALLGLQFGSRLAAAEPCTENPKDFTIVQFTSEGCKCCYDLDEFIQDNDYVYVLFYSTKGRLNIDINAKFEQLAQEWKWTRINFGRIDVDKDRDMSKKWVEPNMIPTNVMYKFGRPVEVKPKDFEQIRDKYQGSPEGQKWMLTKYMGEDGEGSNLHYSMPLMSTKKLAKFIKTHEVAIVGFFRRDNDMHHKIFSESIWQLHQDIDRDDIGAGVAASTLQGVAKKEKAQVPSVVVYLDGKAVEQDGVYAEEKWKKKTLMDFLKQFLPLSDQDIQDDGLQAEESRTDL